MPYTGRCFPPFKESGPTANTPVSVILSETAMYNEASAGDRAAHPGASRDVTVPRLSIVLMPSSNEAQMAIALQTMGPVAIDMDAELIVVLLDGASRELKALVSEARGRPVSVDGASTRPEMCDAAMASLHGDIVLFREAATVSEASVPRTLMQRAATAPRAFVERPLAVKVEPLADVAAVPHVRVTSRPAHVFATSGAHVDFLPADLAQMAVAG